MLYSRNRTYKMLNFFHNAKEEPKIFYCRHIAPGVCAYADETILIGEEALKEMDKTFAGKPIYVNHQKVNLDNLQQEADGYVAESFYLPEDGSHWAKMIIVSDKGHEAIRKGWKVSNAYVPDEFGIGGEWHNVPYNREVMKAHYTHLALVDNPRYEEATVLTPEDFKQYKEEKRAQLKSLENSKQTKGEGKMFNLFKKTAVTSSDDLSKVMVELSNGSAVSIGEMVNSVEEKIKAEEEKKSAKKNALSDVLEGVVKVNGEEMTVKDLVKEYESKCNKCNEDEEDKEKKDAEEGEEDKSEEKKDKKNAKRNAEEEDKEEKKDSEEEKDKEEKESKKNEDVDKRKGIDEIGGFLKDKGLSDEDIRFVIGLAEKLSYEKDEAGKDNEDDEKDIKEDLTVKEEKEKEAKKNAKELLEAEEMANAKGFQGQVVDTMSRRLARGQERYGSAK